MSYRLNMYWRDPEKRSLREYLEDMHGYVKDLAPLDPLLSTWFLQGYSVAAASTYDFVNDFERCARKEARTKMYKDAERIPDRAFVLGLWNGHKDFDEGAISIISTRGTREVDYFWFTLPLPTPESAHLLTPITLASVIRVAMKRWPIHWAHVDTPDYFMTKRVYTDFFGVGWMAYVPAILDPEDFDEAAQVIHIGTQGTVVVTTDEMFDANNDEHVKRAHDIERKLFDRGLLQLIRG